jgi:hypothetical protein
MLKRQISKKLVIPYDDNIRFRKTDDLNWNFERRMVVKKGSHAGEVMWKTCSYHSTLGWACKELALNIADEGSANSLRGYAKELEEIGADIVVRIDKLIHDLARSEADE